VRGGGGLGGGGGGGGGGGHMAEEGVGRQSNIIGFLGMI